MRFCYVSGERKRQAVRKGLVTRRKNHGTKGYSVKPGPKDHVAAAKKAWETRRAKFGPLGGNKKGPKDMSATRTPEYRSNASIHSRKMWSDLDFRKKKAAVMLKVSGKISETLKEGYANGRIVSWVNTDKADSIRAKISDKLIGWANRLKIKNPVRYEQWKAKLLVGHYRRPTKPEKVIQSLNIPGLEYTGDSNFWVHFHGKAKNPDFVIRPFRQKRKVVELFGAMGYYHHEDEIQPLIDAYASIGIACLVIVENELEDLETVRKKILHFINSPALYKLGHIGGGPALQDNTEGRLEAIPEPVETKRQALQKR